MDAQRQALWPLFLQTYGAEARRWWNYWRVFFLACSELFGFDGGREWFVMHYRFRKPGARTRILLESPARFCFGSAA